MTGAVTTLFQDQRFWDRTEEILQPAIAAVNSSRKRGDAVDRIMSRIFNRVHVSAQCVRLIRQHLGDDAAHDAGTLLRSMYDACLQGMYLVHDPQRSAELAQDYEDFSYLERHRMIEKLKKNSHTHFAARLLNSPKRAKESRVLDERIARAKAKFRTGTRKGAKETYHENWYKSNLRSLAEVLKLGLEYDFIITVLHGPVHTSPLAALSPRPTTSAAVADMCAWHLSVRMVAAAMRYHRIEPLNEDIRLLVDEAWECIPTRWEEFSREQPKSKI